MLLHPPLHRPTLFSSIRTKPVPISLVLATPKPNKPRQRLHPEGEAIVLRLKTAVEKLVRSEVDKFGNRVDRDDGQVILMEEMSREIVAKFWLKPMLYLENGDEDIQLKLKDLTFLLRVLEQTTTSSAQR